MRFVCFLWMGHGFLRDQAVYTTRHVEHLAWMLRRHGGHRLTCVIDERLQQRAWSYDVVPMPPEVLLMKDQSPKLWAWSAELGSTIGERYAVIDLDVVLTGNPAYADAGGSACVWRDPSGREAYNTSLIFMNPGAAPQVWNTATPEALARARAESRYWCGDQTWLAQAAPGLRTFGAETGILQWRPWMRGAPEPPPGSRALFMSGPYDPSDEALRCGWVAEAWGLGLAA